MTAEFAVVLPAVLLMLAISIGSLSAQVERMRLVSIAAQIARAAGRGEPAVAERYARVLAGRQLEFSSQGLFACAEVSIDKSLLGLPGLSLRLADKECVRRLGL